MRNKGIFITGTDTDVGKTLIATAIASKLYLRGLNVIPKKPIESGCLNQDGELIPRDAMALIKAAHFQGLLSEVCRYPFAPAISPVRAASLSNKTVTTEQLVAVCKRDSGQQDGKLQNNEKSFLLVEGAGGFYSPLTVDGLNADLAVALQLPMVLVAEDKLGVIGQVLLCAEAIDRHGLQLACVILNTCMPDTAGPGTAEPETAKGKQHRQMDNTADVRQRLSCPVFAIPYAKNGSTELAESLTDAIVDTVLTPPSTNAIITSNCRQI